jgi:aryl-alcohol dehydrogenase-like predicted oxidoreductase
MKLAIGSAQLGMEYGVANKSGKVSLKEASLIISFARSHGISSIDTAINYGDSEKAIGIIGTKDFDIVTKLPSINNKEKNLYKTIKNHVRNSLKNLDQTHLYALLLHRPDELLLPNGDEIWSALQAIKSEGLVSLIGYSIYSPSELDDLYFDYKPDIVQSPYNVIDRRLKSSGWLDTLYKDSVEIHVRSVFLQGLLLMDESSRPKKFNEWKYIWDKWESWLEGNCLSRLEGSLGFVLSDPKITKIVVGVDSLIQLQEIIKASQINHITLYPEELCSNCIKLINPVNWNTL